MPAAPPEPLQTILLCIPSTPHDGTRMVAYAVSDDAIQGTAGHHRTSQGITGHYIQGTTSRALQGISGHCRESHDVECMNATGGMPQEAHKFDRSH